MYCSISCSRACRSPCSWYRRRRILSFSATARHLLRQAHPGPVDVNVVHRRLEHPAQPDAAVLVVLDLVEDIRREWTDDGLELTLARRHPDRDVTGTRISTAEDRIERELEVLEVLDRQVQPDREAAEHEVGDPMKLRRARERERDLVSHELQ